MKKIILPLLLLCFCSVLRADLLDDVSLQLDLLEKEYWRSQHSNASDYRSRVESRLRAMAANVSRISSQLRKMRLPRLVNLELPAGVLVSNYGRMRPATVKRFNLTFNGTSMRDYTREYRSYIRDKEAQEEEKEAEAQGDGKKRKRSRSRSKRPVPTLANVDRIEYERWISEVTASNMGKFLEKRSNGSESEKAKMNDMVSAYLDAVKNLRLGLVKVRQQVKTEFK